jgi:poly(A) polymerase/tRNA nucleotidyltransferase (CCA-adding enzyme)
MATFPIPKPVSHVTKTLTDGGFEAYLVGGCVRDLFLGESPKDWDVATNAVPEEIAALFPKTFYENKFGTVSVVQEDVEDERFKVIEVTPYRTEGEYSDKRRPDSVSFAKTIQEDLSRRDFTINALAYSVEKDELLDMFDGRKDLISGHIRAVGDAKERFDEDALRILRGIRFHSELGFGIDSSTLAAMSEKVELLSLISKERVRDEFVRIIDSPNPSLGLILADRIGALEYMVPELLEAKDVTQNQAHAFDVWTHLLKSLDHAAHKKYAFHVRLAALLHDIGKPASRRWSEEKKDWTFYGHEVIGARMAKNIMERLHFSRETIKKVVNLVRWHMFFSDTEQITLSAVRRMVANVGKDSVNDLIEVRFCDRIGTGRPKESPYRLRKYQSMIEEVMRDPISVGMLAIDGNTIMKEFHEKPGPRLGFLLHALLNDVLEDPKLNTKQELSDRAKKYLELSDKELKEMGERGKSAKEKEEEEELSKIRSKYKVT